MADVVHGGPSTREKRALVQTIERETATTLRVLNAYPPEQANLRPHETCKTAQELGWLLAMGPGLGLAAVRGQLDIEKGFARPAMPGTFPEVVSAFEKTAAELVQAVGASDLAGTARFYTAPKTISDIPVAEFLWFLLHDHIHHRGQFSIYLRLAGGKVPSIYGPSRDEPWF